jgi:hypothetical protein
MYFSVIILVDIWNKMPYEGTKCIHSKRIKGTIFTLLILF